MHLTLSWDNPPPEGFVFNLYENDVKLGEFSGTTTNVDFTGKPHGSYRYYIKTYSTVFQEETPDHTEVLVADFIRPELPTGFRMQWNG